MNELEIQPIPQGPEQDAMLTIQESNPMQMRLIERSGIDAAQWVGLYATRFREMVTQSPELRRLIRKDPAAAAETIEQLLKEQSS